ncbi:MAG: leucyl/phenylalanyl-tRNA--protein transferase [SAR324 cluster bacterium]|nr:leucyl/phenylalanyl-tRNA--protein transferase [SAR324 cluster bacterium]
MTIYLLGEKNIFPSAELAETDGLLAMGGDLKLDRLLLAYQEGIFPWFNEQSSILWWSPKLRCVLQPTKFHISKSLARTIRRANYQISIDKNFSKVIKSCANIKRSGESGTWIGDGMIKAYEHMHLAGYAHSFEVTIAGNLAGGLYGVSLGNLFFAESMFTKVSNASKLALAALVDFCLTKGFSLIDCQIPNQHLYSLGANQIERSSYLEILKKSNKRVTLTGSWSSHANNNLSDRLLDGARKIKNSK